MRLPAPALWFLPVLLLGSAGLWWVLSDPDPAPDLYRVRSGCFEQWVPLAGQLEAEQALSLRTELDGLSKLTWLIEDGTPVQAGETVARFDPSELEEKKLNLARDLEIAEAELRSLTQAQHPLELRRLDSDLRALRASLQEEISLQEDTAELVQENLLPAGELERHRIKIAGLQADILALEEQIQLTRTILHPALEQKAEARRRAARTALSRVEERLQKTQVSAPVAGTVSLPRIPIDGERRPARVGDGLFRNQVFLEISDLTELQVKTRISEQALSSVVPGLSARIRLPAFPEQTLEATVSRVAAHPEGESRRYPVILKLRESPPDLRPGLTAEIEILTLVIEEALLVPSAYLFYEADGARVIRISAAGKSETVPVETGPRTPGMVVIRSGLSPGDRLRRP
ncbi:MAG: efflux RND transporter periplasmic adaptor subunit [Kiritimatiellia bacterium]